MHQVLLPLIYTGEHWRLERGVYVHACGALESCFTETQETWLWVSDSAFLTLSQVQGQGGP